MEEFVRARRLGPAHEVVLKISVPRLDKVVRVNSLQWDFTKGNGPLRHAFVPNITDVGHKAVFRGRPFVYKC